MVVLSVLLASTVGNAPTFGRQSIKFDFGWRWRLGGVQPQTCPAAVAKQFTPFTNEQCTGLTHVSAAAAAAQCLAACCRDPSCEIWSWGYRGAQKAKGSQCWIGACNSRHHLTPVSNDSWVGGSRPVGPSPSPSPPPTPVPVPAEAEPGFDDSRWELVDAPHDYVIAQPYDKAGGFFKGGFFPRNDSIYRKHFSLPSAWRMSAAAEPSVYRLRFEGVYKVATVWLNGRLVAMYGDSSAAYTGFSVPLSVASGLRVGDGEANVIAIGVDASYGTEHWYVGAGMYRHVWLEKLPALNIVDNGVYAPAFVDLAPGGTYSATVEPTVTVANNGSVEVTAAVTEVTVKCELFNVAGALVATSTKTFPVVLAAGGGSAKLTPPVLMVQSPSLWTVKTPNLYTLVTTTVAGSSTDQVNATIGFRELTWSHSDGLAVNGERVKIRGFCHHNDFSAVGMAVPERINLFRGQSMRALGGNGWRMSHNPYRGTLYDTLDRLGILVWDETRDLREPQLPAFGEMVREHRNHPSVMIWSFCNEGGCKTGNNETLGALFNHTAKVNDRARLVSGNMRGGWGPGTLTDHIDVQGYSHPAAGDMDQIHAKVTGKAFIASECCSCQTNRGEDYANATVPVPSSFNAPCLADQVNRSDDGRPWSVGSMVWTLFDYFGEPFGHTWPNVASSYGSFDVAGFPKAAVWWYRALWLDGIDEADAGRPPMPKSHTTRIVQETLAPPPPGGPDGRGQQSANMTVNVYTDSATVELFLNGNSLGSQPVTRYMWATFSIVVSPGNLTAVGRSASGEAESSHSIFTPGVAVAIQLSIDAPSVRTGTGSSLVLDGQDVGMLRASIVDGAGRVVPSAAHNISFVIKSGPGRILGVGNGDPTNHEPNQAPWRSAYHGLVRGIVQVTADGASPGWHRRALSEVDLDGGVRTAVRTDDGLVGGAEAGIIVEASADGLSSGSVTVPVSSDMATHSVLAVAARSVATKSMVFVG